MDREFLENLHLPQEAVEAVLQQYGAEMEELSFSRALDDAITAAHGRSGKAIRAMLDLPGLRQSPDREAAIGQALAELKGECAYLFETPAPPYAPGPGAAGVGRRYTMEELGRLPMEEYRAYRQGRR